MTKKVLLVEDDPFLLKVFVAHLQKAGIGTIAIDDGGKAVDAVVRSKPALVLLDISLPHKNGFSILEELKRKNATKKIPVFIITKLKSDEDRALGLKLGAALFFSKDATTFSDVMKEIVKRLA